jgi:hypothetical protein
MPEGHPFIHVGVAAAEHGQRPHLQGGIRETFPAIQATGRPKRQHSCARTGFNGTGNWSADETLAAAPQRLVYTRGLGFMTTFAKKLGITHVVPGHTGYSDELIPVFHPEFPKFRRGDAQQLAATKDDPGCSAFTPTMNYSCPSNPLNAISNVRKLTGLQRACVLAGGATGERQ